MQDIANLKEYLKRIIVFEDYVYIWETTMNELNSQMKCCYEEENEINRKIETIDGMLANVDALQHEEMLKQLTKNNKIKNSVIITRIITIVSTLNSVISGIVMFIYNDVFIGQSVLYNLIYCVVFAIAFYVFSCVGPVTLVISIVQNKKYKKYNNTSIDYETIKANRIHNLSEKSSELDAHWVQNMAKEIILQQEQEKVFKALNEAKNVLMLLYGKNIIHAKYQNYTAVVMFYEYLDTGRCVSINGFGGIYDTYERDMKENQKIALLRDIRDCSIRNEKNTMLMYQEMQRTNYALNDIKLSLENIENTNREIANNSAISATANQQTALATEWMARDLWFKQ